MKKSALDRPVLEHLFRAFLVLCVALITPAILLRKCS